MTEAASQLQPAEDEEDIVLSLDAFVRSIGIRRGATLSFFIGAGASISSGLPSAEMCIWEWKRSIFLTNNPGLEDQFAELSLPGIRRRIQQWLDAQGRFPPEGAPEEYGFYIQQCFPIAEDRRAYFQEKVREARPHIGYQLLCQLAEANLVRSAWSTNFDGLAARAAAPFSLTPLEVGFDDLMTHLALHCLRGKQREAARHLIAAFAPGDLEGIARMRAGPGFDGRQPLSRATERLVKRFHHREHLWPRDAVVDRRAHAARFHEPVGAQPHQLL